MDERISGTVLLVDDNSENIEFLDEALGDIYTIMAATDGYTALEIVENHPPDLILLDIVMPGIDGYEVCKKLKENSSTASIPVIFLTGRKNLDDKNRGFELGAVDYITKPFEIIEIKARVKNHLMVRKAQHFLEYKNRFLESEVYNRNLELSQTQADLEESEEKFRLLFEKSSSSIALVQPIFDEEGLFQDYIYNAINPVFLRLLKKSQKEVVGKRESDLFPMLDEDWFDIFRNTAELGETEFFEVYHPVLEKYLNGSSFKPQIEKNYFWIIINDATEQILYQKELEKAKDLAEESDRLKSAFLANISHEIRTPLNGIIGFTQLIKQDNTSHQNREQYYGIIENCSRNLVTIIDEIIDFARIESGSFYLDYQEISINKLIHQEAVFYRNELKNLGKKEIQIEEVLPLPEGKDLFISDSIRLQKIFKNLMSNTVKFTEKGKIWLGYDINEVNRIEFFVRDTGIGISDKSKEYIFNSFRQEKEGYNRAHGGMGLGLAITKKMVEQMGGEIRVESNKGKGSSFIFAFTSEGLNPMDSQNIINTRKISQADLLQRKTVLLVESNPLIQDNMDKLLRLRKMETLTASEPEELDREIRVHPEIEVIIISYSLFEKSPEKITQSLFKFYEKIKIIFYFKEEEKVPSKIQLPYQGILKGPLDPLELFQTLDRVIRED